MGGYDETIETRADHVAVRCGDRRRTYRELGRRADSLGGHLQSLGLAGGGRLAIMLPNEVDYVECLAASAMLGCAAVSLNWHLPPDEVADVLADSGADVLVTHEDLRAVVEAAGSPCPVTFVDGHDGGPGTEVDTGAGELASPRPYRWPTSWPVIYTSGTTGRPKGVVHGAVVDPELLRLTQDALAGMWGYGPADVHLVAGPLYHAGPQGYAALTLHAGGTVEIMPSWEPVDFCRIVQAHRVTTTFLTPAHFIRLLELGPSLGEFDLSSLRHVIHAGAPCPTVVKERIMAALPHSEVWELYGMSEGGATRVGPDDWRAHPGTVGLPWPGVEVRIVDPQSLDPLPPGEDGLVYVKPAHGRFRYHRDDERTAAAWHDDAFTVGDIGHLDEDGWLYLTDRAVDLVIRGGVNVAPRRVEEVLHRHPDVVDCAVFGVPDERDGEHLHAMVELRDGTVTPEELLAHCRTRLDAWSCPSTVEIVDVLPRDPNGKVLKRRLREAAWSGTGRRI